MKRRLLAAALFTLFTICVLEGLSSLFSAYHLAVTPPYAERVSTRHDPEIGWVGHVDFHQEDFYGPGRHLNTDSRGFRRAHDAGAGTPVIAITGDSFALGYGVSDRDSWAARLGRDLDATTINMGQGGYGPGQAWLWYRRHEPSLDHDVLLFTMILPDLDRFALHHYNAPKAKLGLRDGEPVVVNEPVPRPSRTSWLQRTAIGQLIERGNFRYTDLDRPGLHDELEPILAAILDDLVARAGDGRRVVFVLLPWNGHNRLWRGEDWAGRIDGLCRGKNIPFWNLGEEYGRMNVSELDDFFIAPGEIDYPGATGHYTEVGNSKVAAWLADRVTGLEMFTSRRPRH